MRGNKVSWAHARRLQLLRAEVTPVTQKLKGLGMGSYANYLDSHQKKVIPRKPHLFTQETPPRTAKATVEIGEKGEFFCFGKQDTHTSAFPVHARPRTGRLCPLPCIVGLRACTEKLPANDRAEERGEDCVYMAGQWSLRLRSASYPSRPVPPQQRHQTHPNSMPQGHTSTAPVQSRRTHTKSRKGCQTCKNRHIRCDETAPQWFVYSPSPLILLTFVSLADVWNVQQELHKTQCAVRLYGRGSEHHTRDPAGAGYLAQHGRIPVPVARRCEPALPRALLANGSEVDSSHLGDCGADAGRGSRREIRRVDPPGADVSMQISHSRCSRRPPVVDDYMSSRRSTYADA